MTKREVVTPEWFYHPLFVTPAIFKPGSTALKTFRFPIKDFGNDGGRTTKKEKAPRCEW